LPSWAIELNSAVKTLTVCGLAFCATSASPPGDGGRELVVIYTGDGGAEIESCGCNLLAYGGLARRATLVDFIRARYPDAVFVEVGDFFSPTAGEQDRLKNEITAEAYGGYAYDAVNLGEDDFNFGADFVRDLLEANRIPAISANVRDVNGKPFAPASRVVTKAGLNVGIVGFLNPELAAGKKLSGADLQPYQKSLKTAAAELAGQADVLICLAHIGNVDKARAFAAKCPKEIDVVVAGHRGGKTLEAENVKGRWMVYTRSRNRYVGMLKLTLDGDANVVAAENHVLPVTKETPKNETTQALVDKYYATLRKLVDEKKLLKPPEDIPPGGFIYAGSARCGDCHAPQVKQWQETAHGAAYASLEDAGRETDPECVGCHVTGYGFRGGFVAGPKPASVNVGCEECHGPGEGHAQAPAVKTAAVTEATCLRCHDAERSPAFNYPGYLEAAAH
jgi:2',3'-cyclic-nucleotide 2'-phosphodiesterase (5'-nucleotidase family)